MRRGDEAAQIIAGEMTSPLHDVARWSIVGEKTSPYAMIVNAFVARRSWFSVLDMNYNL